MAAFYPTLTLNGSVGLEAGSLLKWFTWPARVWSVGPTLAETLFDAGPPARGGRGAARGLRCDRRELPADGADGVPTGGGQSGGAADSGAESAKDQETIQAANRALTVSTAQYTAGTVNYLTVITAQATLLTAQVSAVTILTRRLTASVVLIQALGGGWNESELPSTQAVAAQGPSAGGSHEHNREVSDAPEMLKYSKK